MIMLALQLFCQSMLLDLSFDSEVLIDPTADVPAMDGHCGLQVLQDVNEMRELLVPRLAVEARDRNSA